MLKRSIYFDNAATTPLLPEVKGAMTEAMEVFGNPASIHAEGRRSKVFLEECRTRVASVLGLQPAEVFFTSGGTESLQTILLSALRDLNIKRIVTTSLEHPAVLKNLESLRELFSFDLVHAPFDRFGRVDTDALDELLAGQPQTLVVLMHANNETGMLLPVKRVASICQQHNALFLSDTVQTVGKYRIDFSEGIDFAAASAHKFHGPKGVGLLMVKGGAGLKPLILGGGQERTMRSGTENLIGVAGMVKALELADEALEKAMPHVETLRQSMLTGLTNLFDNLKVLTLMEHSLYTILNVGFPVQRVGEMLVNRLDMEGIAVSGGSACASGVNHPSHVLEGLSVEEHYVHARFSFSRLNTMEEVERCLGVMRNIYS